MADKIDPFATQWPQESSVFAASLAGRPSARRSGPGTGVRRRTLRPLKNGFRHRHTQAAEPRKN